MKPLFQVYLFFLLQILLVQKLCSQTPVPPNIWQPNFVSCKVELKIIDSNYYLIPSLVISDTSKVIKIKKKFFYDQHDGADGIFYLRKQVRRGYISILIDNYKQPSHLYNELVPFGFKDCLNDTINIANEYPLEIGGHYQIMLEMNYFYRKKRYSAFSDWIDFDVFFLPKKSIFN